MTNIQDSTVSEPEIAYCFDVDGVLTEPEAKKVLVHGLFGQIASRLNKGYPVALITGRSLPFMESRIVDPLRLRLDSDGDLTKLFAIGEKGGAFFSFDENGVKSETISPEYAIPEYVLNEARDITSERFSKSMFWDEEKLCMASIEFLDKSAGGTVPFEDFQAEQKRLVSMLKELLVTYSCGSTFEVDATTIATDLQDSRLGKDLAADVFLSLLSDQGIAPAEFKCFGDSASDYAMHSRLQEQDEKSSFIYVGQETDLDEEQSANNVLFTGANGGEYYDKGTFRYLAFEFQEK